ncbi:MAG: ABC transporter ATP-binding protein [Erysipelotrichaceae bacterium]|nr:ABC transporter ATP-binding protein [Erysipelotrichaceae bacterium]
MLEIKNFTKKYSKNKIAVKDLSLTVESGDIYAFIGHNGAGKTTTIKSIVGIQDFDEGEILIDHLSIKTQTIKAQKLMAYIPDNPDIYTHLTGLQYLNFIADIYQIDTDTQNQKIKKYAELFEIETVLNDLISSYSHGMKQKLVIISALIHDPKLLVLDEPFVGLDPKASLTLKQIMKEICANGSAIFFSTHVLEVAEKLCNKVAIIKEGQLIASGTMSEVRGNESLEDIFMELTDHE